MWTGLRCDFTFDEIGLDELSPCHDNDQDKSGRGWLASVRGMISFVAGLGIRLFAAKGKVEIQAQSDAMALAALKELTISSTDGRIIITAAKEVWLGAGGSYIQINGSGIVNATSGYIHEKTADWDKPGSDSVRMPLPTMPLSSFPETPDNPYVQVFDASAVITNLGTGSALDGLPYRVYLPDGTLQQQGMLNDGATIKVRTAQSEKVKCEIGAGDWGAIEDGFDHDELDES